MQVEQRKASTYLELSNNMIEGTRLSSHIIRRYYALVKVTLTSKSNAYSSDVNNYHFDWQFQDSDWSPVSRPSLNSIDGLLAV
jgi:hypothetical protein